MQTVLSSISLHSRHNTNSKLVLESSVPRQNQLQVVSLGISPLLNSRLISELSHVVLLKATSEPRAGKDGQLFSRLHNGRIQMPLALFLGVYPPVLIRPLDLDVP